MDQRSVSLTMFDFEFVSNMLVIHVPISQRVPSDPSDNHHSLKIQSTVKQF